MICIVSCHSLRAATTTTTIVSILQWMHIFELRVLSKYLICLKLLVELLSLHVLFNLLHVTIVHYSALLRHCEKEVGADED